MSADPRVFFAAERTLLAWVRSSITVMALGFVVAKFGLFLTLLASSRGTLSEHHHDIALSNVFGIVLVVIGVVILLVAQLNHRLYVRTLPAKDVPQLAVNGLASLLTYSVALIGSMLAVYLALA